MRIVRTGVRGGPASRGKVWDDSEIHRSLRLPIPRLAAYHEHRSSSSIPLARQAEQRMSTTPHAAVSPSEPLLVMRAIGKSFGGARALDGVSIEVHAGEVHALCGENGAGKSTLMKILAGAIVDYEGEIVLRGAPERFSGTREAEDAGVRIIHQELNLVPELTAAANIFLGREQVKGGWFGWLDDRGMEARARTLFERLGASISPRARVCDLRIGDQQMVEIAKAIAFDAAVVIMDEPTSALSDAEVDRLFRVIGDLKRSGAAVLYISHKMNEVFTLSDRVTVLRDGRFVTSTTRSETTPDAIVRAMVGRQIAEFHHDPTQTYGPDLLEVEGLSLASPAGSGRPALQDLCFRVRSGEVLGVAGLLGSGRTELLEALFGASLEAPRGAIKLEGQPAHFRHPAEAARAGLALVTEDRKSLGLFAEMTVAENITLTRLARLTIGPFVNPKSERSAVDRSIADLAIKTAGRKALITSLSGGNQQKCILARWLLTEPRLLLLDEPTRGVDVGAKAEIYELIRKLAREGRAVIMTSSELPELLAVADRILVLCEGRITADIPRALATEELVMTAAVKFLDRGTGESSLPSLTRQVEQKG